VHTVSDEESSYLSDQFVPTLRTLESDHSITGVFHNVENSSVSRSSCRLHRLHFHILQLYIVSFNCPPLGQPDIQAPRRFGARDPKTLHSTVRLLRICHSFNSLPFFQLRRSGEFVDRRSPPPVLVPGLTLMFERRVRHVAGPLLNSHRCGPSAPPWTPIYRCPHSLATSEAFAVQTLRMGFHLVDPPLPAPAALPQTLLHGRP